MLLKRNKVVANSEVEDFEFESFDDWYNSDQSVVDWQEFAEELYRLVNRSFDVEDMTQEPSIQGYAGNDYIWITLKDGSKYEFKFNWMDEQDILIESGPKDTAKYYYRIIRDGIRSGSNRV